MNDSTQRFSNRVENYVKYRPGYPPQVLSTLIKECALQSASVVADVGSGTGISTEVFLRNGNMVYGVEPNDAMRQAAERLLNRYENFYSVQGTAEATTLSDKGVDFVVAGQAFHWFDRHTCKEEFRRILQPQGWVVLLWNERRTLSTPFLQSYERLLEEFATDYTEVNHAQISDDMIADFYAPGAYRLRRFDNHQTFDFEALQGRLLSSSYAPEAGHPNFKPMLAELRRIFEAYQENGEVRFEYDTQVYFGQLNTHPNNSWAYSDSPSQ